MAALLAALPAFFLVRRSRRRAADGAQPYKAQEMGAVEQRGASGPGDNGAAHVAIIGGADPSPVRVEGVGWKELALIQLPCTLLALPRCSPHSALETSFPKPVQAPGKVGVLDANAAAMSHHFTSFPRVAVADSVFAQKFSPAPVPPAPASAHDAGSPEVRERPRRAAEAPMMAPRSPA